MAVQSTDPARIPRNVTPCQRQRNYSHSESNRRSKNTVALAFSHRQAPGEWRGAGTGTHAPRCGAARRSGQSSPVAVPAHLRFRAVGTHIFALPSITHDAFNSLRLRTKRAPHQVASRAGAGPHSARHRLAATQHVSQAQSPRRQGAFERGLLRAVLSVPNSKASAALLAPLATAASCDASISFSRSARPAAFAASLWLT